MNINVEKSKIMTTIPSTDVTDEKQLENMEQFNYLGRMITNGARCTREIKSRVVIAITFTELLILSHITCMRQTGQGMVPFTQINLQSPVTTLVTDQLMTSRDRTHYCLITVPFTTS